MFGIAVLSEIVAVSFGYRNDALADQAMAVLRRSAGDAKQSAIDAADAARRAIEQASDAEASAHTANEEADDAGAELCGGRSNYSRIYIIAFTFLP